MPTLQVLEREPPPLSSWKLFDPNVAADLDLFLAGGLFASVHFSKLGLSSFLPGIPEPRSRCFVDPCRQSQSA